MKPIDIQAYLSSKKKIVDEALQGFLTEPAGVPPVLCEAMKYSLLAGGKRIRALLVCATAEALYGDLEPVLPVACALELIHTFSLIHDDLPAMDDDNLRRGKPTNHKVFGEGVAILAGDGLLAKAFYILSGGSPKSPVRHELLLDVIRDIAFATGPEGMVGGQILDLKAQGASLNEREIETMHRYKTGSLIAVSVTSGAKMSGANASELQALKRYGENVGLAFQIADDILNVEGRIHDIGKSVGSDLSNKKSTYPKILGLEPSKKKAEELILEALASLEDFDESADPLRGIASFIVQRKS